ncbi:hypothetical protein C3Y93_00570 [Acinetobacter sp. SWBY1]|nr:hypothetical protein C3Y93_00570 [Acinetobacter sp. SWBY1]
MSLLCLNLFSEGISFCNFYIHLLRLKVIVGFSPKLKLKTRSKGGKFRMPLKHIEQEFNHAEQGLLINAGLSSNGSDHFLA